MTSIRKKYNRHRGLTLVELLLYISLLAILGSLILQTSVETSKLLLSTKQKIKRTESIYMIKRYIEFHSNHAISTHTENNGLKNNDLTLRSKDGTEKVINILTIKSLLKYVTNVEMVYFSVRTLNLNNLIDIYIVFNDARCLKNTTQTINPACIEKFTISLI